MKQGVPKMVLIQCSSSGRRPIRCLRLHLASEDAAAVAFTRIDRTPAKRYQPVTLASKEGRDLCFIAETGRLMP